MEMDYQAYDKFATELFGPIYPDIAKQIVERTGIREGYLLDLGCGGGHLGFALLKLGKFKPTFFDLSQEMVDIAWKRSVEQHVNANFVQGDVHHMKFTDDCFHLIVSRGSMPFWTDQRQAFREIYRVLRPGGKAYIGGGMGSSAHRKRIKEAMAAKGGATEHIGPRTGLPLATEEYETLFRELGAEYQVIENEEEGRWFLFGKPAK